MGHVKMHNIKREPQRIDVSIPASITAPSSIDGPAPTSIVADSGSKSALSTYTQSFEETVSQPASTFLNTRVQTILVTDSAQLSSIQASATSTSTDGATSAAKTSSASSETSTGAAKSSSSSNLGTLIPAIVVPVAAILIISFAIFWFIMRRKHRKQLDEEPEFVMADKLEKPISRGNSNSSGTSSTRELVPMSKLEKEVAVTTSEVRRSSLDMFPPRYTTTDIGVARPMTPPDKAGANADGNGQRPVPNFSKSRPTTSHRSTPGQDRHAGTRSRGQSASSTRGAPQPRLDSRISPIKPSRGPSPTMGGQMRQSPRPSRPQDAVRRPGARSPPGSQATPLNTNMNNGARAAPPKPLNPPTPTGAFNGASPISQYSPIVKGHQNLGAVAAANMAEQRSQPLPLNTSNLPGSTGTNSPVDENVLSHENMRIARLANSSRLGFNRSPVGSTSAPRGNGIGRALSPLSEKDTRGDGPALSPQLPPPLTREDLPPRPFARGPDSPSGGSSVYPSPSIGTGAIPSIGGGYSTTSLPQSDHNTIGMASSTGLPHRASIVSRISSDDGYMDEELDAKSEVSSLDERERWDMESDRHEAASQLGTGYNGSRHDSAGMSPIDAPAAASSAGTEASRSNMRDRDSEGPFVLSRY